MESTMNIQVFRGEGNEYQLPPNVILLRLPDGTGQLLDLDGEFHALSNTAVEMLHDILDGDTASAAKKSALRYSAPLPTVRSDLDAFVRDLTARGLIRPAGETSRLARRRSTLLSQIVLRSLRAIIGARAVPINMRIAALMALSQISVRILGWPQTVATWQACYRERPTSRETAPDSRRLADFIGETTRRLRARYPLPLDCKDQALSSWALLRDQGLRPALVVGVAFPAAFHCWCELDGVFVGDDEFACKSYTPVARYV